MLRRSQFLNTYLFLVDVVLEHVEKRPYFGFRGGRMLLVYFVFTSVSIFSSPFGNCPLPVACAAETKLYRILGVSPNASKEEIARAYRQLAKELHPDKHPEKEKQFMEVAYAHEVLSDPNKRRIYDQYGIEGLKEAEKGGFTDQNAQHATFTQGFPGGFGSFNDFSGIFEQFGEAGYTFHFAGPDGKYRTFRQSSHSAGSYASSQSIYGDTDVIQLGENDFDEQIAQLDFMMVINFYNPQCHHCRTMKDDYIELAKKLKRMIPVAAVNCAKHQNVCRQNLVRNYPKISIYFGSNYGNRRLNYDSNNRHWSAIMNWISENIPSDVEALNEKNFEYFLYDQRIPIIILFSDKKNIPLLFKVISREFGKRLRFGIIFSYQRNLIGKFKNKNLSFPAILHLQDPDSLEGEWLKSKLFSLEYLSLTFSRIVAEHRAASGRYGTQTFFGELTMRRLNNGDCSPNDGQYCFILFKFIKDTNSIKHAQIVDDVKIISKKYRHDPIKITWIDAKQQSQFAKSFGLENSCRDSDCFKFVAYRPKRKKFKLLDDTINSETLDKFIDSIINGATILNGKISSSPVLIDKTMREMYDEF